MGYYPVFLELAGRPCLVVGGGPVALRKVQGLLGAGARVIVVSPRLSKGLLGLAQVGQINAIQRRYRRGDLRGMTLAIAATNQPRINGRVAADAERRGVLVNVVDEPGLCRFIVPSVARRGDLVVALSTGGRSPAVAKRLRRELEAWLDKGPAQLLELAAEVRQELRRQGQRTTPGRWQRALDASLLALLQKGQRAAARRRLLSALGVTETDVVSNG